MSRLRFGMAVMLIGMLATAGLVSADVKTTEKSQLKFEGMLGRMMGLFGGKAMKDGVVNTVAVKGDRKVTADNDSATIVDLAEEKIYEVNIRDKSYKVITFAEMKRRMEEARAKAEEDARKQQTREKKDPNQKEMEIDFSVKDTGQKRQINGFNCREVIVTIAMHEKGKTLEQAGGFLMTSDMWLAPRVAAMKEIEEFDMRYARAMSDLFAMPSAEAMAQAFAMYPGMKDAMARLQKESVNMEGTPIETVTTFQSVMTKEQAAQAKKEEGQGGGSPGGALGGVLGRFGRKKEEPKPAEGTAKASPDSETRATIMTTTHSLMSVGTSVSADEIAVPAGFRLKK